MRFKEQNFRIVFVFLFGLGGMACENAPVQNELPKTQTPFLSTESEDLHFQLQGPSKLCFKDAGYQICHERFERGIVDFKSVHGLAGKFVFVLGGRGIIWGFDIKKNEWKLLYQQTDVVLKKLIVINENEAWAIGQKQEHSFLLRWNGIHWRSPNDLCFAGMGRIECTVLKGNQPFDNMSLNNIYATNDQTIWLVGDRGGKRGVIYKIHQKTISEEVLPGSVSGLHAIWASGASDVWAGGGDGQILQYDGTSWKKIETGKQFGFTSIWGSGPNDIWITALGMNMPGHYDGQKWEFSFKYQHFLPVHKVWGSGPNDVWFAGQSVLGHYDGKNWKSMSPLIERAGWIDDIWGSSPTDIWIVGNKGTLVHFDGVDWKSFNNPAPNFQTGAIWGSGSNDIWFIQNPGVTGLYAQLAHFDGNIWSQTKIDSTYFFSDIWGSGPNNIWIVGHNGGIFHYNGSNWNAVSSGGTTLFSRIWGSGPKDIWALGETTLLHYEGTKWTDVADSVDSGVKRIFSDIWGSGPNDIWLVGPYGSNFHYDGKWNQGKPMTNYHLMEVWGHAVNDVWTLGADALYHFDGIGWSRSKLQIPNPANKMLRDGPYAMWAFSSMYGDNNLFHYDGKDWVSIHTGADDAIKDGWSDSLGHTWFTTSTGGVIHLQKLP